MKRKKILIVEDDQLCAFVTEYEAKKYYDTHTVTNGYDAIAALEKDKYDGILMDINLGDESMTGIHTMQKIRNSIKYKRVKIFAHTVYSGTSEFFVRQGFDDLVQKPLTAKKIELIMNAKMPNHVKGSSLIAKDNLELV